MIGYLARRLALSAATLLLITMAVYAAARLAPGDPVDGESGMPAAASSWARNRHMLDSVPMGYARWLAGLARLDLGVSIGVSPGRPVASLVADALPYTLALGVLSFLLTLSVALPLGILSAWQPRSVAARGATAALYAMDALPVFWIALALQGLFASRLGWLPVLFAGPAEGSVGLAGLPGRAPYWILPTLAITLGSLAFVIRFCRASLLEELGEPYTQAARARGAGELRVVTRHALANTGVPLLSLAGMTLPGIVSGSILVESIFALPGVGRLLFSAAEWRDYPVVLAVTLLAALATLAASLVADLLYRVADPRITIHESPEVAPE